MITVLAARKATKRKRGRAKNASRSIDYVAHYRKYGRKYYVANRSKILKKARTRYAANKAKYKKMQKRWLRKTNKGKNPLYKKGKGQGRKPKFPRLKPIYQKVAKKGSSTKSSKKKRNAKKSKRSRAALKAWKTRKANAKKK